MVMGYELFVSDASFILACGDWSRRVKPKKNRLCGPAGVLAKKKPGLDAVDEDAGYRGKTDFEVKFGHEAYGGKVLMTDEAKFFEEKPDMTRPWIELVDNHLSEFMLSLVGKLATVAAATCNYGMKVVLVETPDGGASTLSASPPGEVYLDFDSTGAWEFAFDWWLEITALAVPPPSDGVHHRPAAPPQNRTILTQTSAGHTVTFTSIDLEAVLTPKELDQIRAQFEKEKEQEMEALLSSEGES